MKVMLIAQPGQETIKGDLIHLIHEERGVNPPIGLLYVASSLLNNSTHQVKVLDASIDRLSIEQIKQDIREFGPDVVGMTLTTFSLFESIRIAKAAKEINVEIKVVVGGIHLHIFPYETIHLGCFDYGVMGEAEYSVIKLMDAIEYGSDLSDVKGMIYRKDGRTTFTGMPDFIEDLDAIPFPDRTLVPYKQYNSIIAKANPVTIMVTSRGCPFRCTFCDRPHMGKRFRMRSADNVVDEFAECSRLGIKEILVYDDTFTANRRRVIDICKKLIERKIEIYWGVRARVDTVNEEMLRLLKEAGCVRLNYGVESGNPEILKRLNKDITLEQVESAFRLTKKYKMDALAYFMIGCPGDTKETIRDSVEFAKKLEADYVHFTILMPFPATTVYQEAMEKGLIKGDVWREFAKNPQGDFEIPVYEENLKRAELMQMLGNCNRAFYFRPKFILNEIFRMRKPSQLWREARAAIKVLLDRG